ncbi:MAG: hypothetical protein K0S32_4367 [Bacteroidetes bacterium]|jgi:hypothetical protein|nr:hypothetical protein [Bacteroidota bacterium]
MRHFINIDNNAISKLCETNWDLTKVEETLDKFTRAYSKKEIGPPNRSDPEFFKDGSFKDIGCKGSWCTSGKLLQIDITKDTIKNNNLTSLRGDLFIKQINDTSLVIQKNIDRIGTWIKVFYFRPKVYKKDITFKVQFAKSKQPLDLSNDKYSSVPEISTSKSGQTTIYTSGNFSDAESVLKRLEFLKVNFPLCFIVAFNKEKPISVSDALDAHW